MISTPGRRRASRNDPLCQILPLWHCWDAADEPDLGPALGGWRQRAPSASAIARSYVKRGSPAQLAALRRANDGYSGQFITRCVFRLALLLFVRPGELRHAEWAEFDLDAAEWQTPAAKMKMRKEHMIPLPKQGKCQSVSAGGRCSR